MQTRIDHHAQGDARATGGHALVERLAADLMRALKDLGKGTPHMAPAVAALALTLDEELTHHLRAEEEALFPLLERTRLAIAVRLLRHEHEILRLQSSGVRHLAARIAGGGRQAEEASLLLWPHADAFLEGLAIHSHREEDVVFPQAAEILGDRVDERIAEILGVPSRA